MQHSTKRRLLGGGLFVGALLLLSGQSFAETELTVYTALEADQIERYTASFNAQHPDIKLNIVRDSTGIVTAKFLAEKDNPQADVIWGLAATSLLLFKTEGLLESYDPPGSDALDPRMKDKDSPLTWVGMDAYSGVICFNTVEAEKHGIPAPTSWADLTNAAYKGHVVMPNPASSGTGFLDVAGWMQIMGEEAAWAFMDGLHENIQAYTHSGSKPCKMAASGETVVGVSFDYRAAKSKSEGAPLEVIVPSEGIGWELEASAIVKDTPNLEAAQALIDWSISAEAMKLYNANFAVVALPGIAEPVENMPENLEAAMIDNDFEWSANNRTRILEEWSKRYDSKSEPKS